MEIFEFLSDLGVKRGHEMQALLGQGHVSLKSKSEYI